MLLRKLCIVWTILGCYTVTVYGVNVAEVRQKLKQFSTDYGKLYDQYSQLALQRMSASSPIVAPDIQPQPTFPSPQLPGQQGAAPLPHPQVAPAPVPPTVPAVPPIQPQQQQLVPELSAQEAVAQYYKTPGIVSTTQPLQQPTSTSGSSGQPATVPPVQTTGPSAATLRTVSLIPTNVKLQQIKIQDADYGLRKLEDQRILFDPFRFVMGVTEQEFKAKDMQAFIEYKREGSQSKVLIGNTQGTNPTLWQAGTFTEHSIGELRAQYAKTTRGNGCAFTVIEALDKPFMAANNSGPNWYRALVDTPSLQADPQNIDAVFQIASNFNGLEGGGSPAAGIMPYTTNFYYVQGEAAALSAMPGLIYRMYYVPHKVSDQTYVGQLTQQINFLSNVPAITIANGYPKSVQLDAFTNLTAEQYDAYVQKVKIGFHKGTQVSSGLGPLKNDQELTGQAIKAIPINNENQIINQVLTAAFNLAGASDNRYAVVARMLLDAAYEGTLKSAYIHGKKKVFLTLVGGGVFKNDLEWIIGAITKALDDFVNKGDMHICLIIYSTSQFPANKVTDMRYKLLSYVQAMKGTYIQFNSSGQYQLSVSAS